jgi:hypothetical protein
LGIDKWDMEYRELKVYKRERAKETRRRGEGETRGIGRTGRDHMLGDFEYGLQLALYFAELCKTKGSLQLKMEK